MPDNYQKGRSRSLRRNMTDSESRLWRLLRDRRLSGAKFRRQHPVGPYTADFYCHEHKLVIEADGGQHLESQHDAKRTAFMQGQGLKVVRFWNNDILNNREAVLEQIFSLISMNEPSPAATRRPLPEGEAKATALQTALIGSLPEGEAKATTLQPALIESLPEREAKATALQPALTGSLPEGEAKATTLQPALIESLPEGEAKTTEETGS